MNRYRITGLAVAAAGMVGGAVWAAQPGTKLMLNETALSTQVRLVEGRAYVPLVDLARALNMGVEKKPYGYALSPLSEAARVGRPHLGKSGAELSTGKWGFEVLGLTEGGEYLPKYLPDREAIRPAGEGDTLVAVQCRIRNLQKETQKIAFDASSASGNTALLDAQQHSYPPFRFDVHHTGSSATAQAHPGSVVDFAVIFSVPKGTQARDLVYTLTRYDERYSSLSGTDIRISLH